MNLGFGEMFFIFLLALIIFGPKKLPEIGRQIGKALSDFKRYSNDFKYQLESEVRQWEIEETLRKEKEDLKQSILPEGTIPSDMFNMNSDSQPSTSSDLKPAPEASPYSEQTVPSTTPSKETNA